ncbi:type II toxin-antitoxin system PemK/MazF family toxin [Micromonospora echinospora]|uniref:type II toxin-antitoxin system PemK/MazF family toxin n=1 Tax=Micromonospora echinospora TaxID=1877 RepID=UPI00366B6E56
MHRLLDPATYLDLVKLGVNLGLCLGITVALVVTVRRWVGGRSGVLRTSDLPGRPRPGEIWWAEVPYVEGTGSKVRPCLVLRVHPRFVDVLKITSRARSWRTDHVVIPTASWDQRATHDSHLDLSRVFRVSDGAFVRRAGSVDSATWRRTLPHRLRGVFTWLG